MLKVLLCTAQPALVPGLAAAFEERDCHRAGVCSITVTMLASRRRTGVSRRFEPALCVIKTSVRFRCKPTGSVVLRLPDASAITIPEAVQTPDAKAPGAL